MEFRMGKPMRMKLHVAPRITHVCPHHCLFRGLTSFMFSPQGDTDAK